MMHRIARPICLAVTPFARRSFVSVAIAGAVAFSVVRPQSACALSKASEAVYEQLKAEGRLDALIEQTAHLVARQHEEMRRAGVQVTAPDSVHALAFLVDFPDYEADEDAHPPAHYEKLLYSEGEMATGSAREYYTENSYGQFQFAGDVTTIWYRAPHNMAGWYCNADGIPGTGDDYGMGNDSNKSMGGLIRDVVEMADPDVDFSRYDTDEDGVVDAIFFIHAGPGAERTGNPDHIWSHRGWVNVWTDDGVQIVDYSTEPEADQIGVFVHEFGHVLNLPDLYDTDYSSSGVGDWSVMASGSDPGGISSRPAHYDAWSKVQLGWVDPIVIVPNDVVNNPFEVPRVEDHPVVYKLPTNNNPNWEYFLVENRQKVLFDEYLPGEGLLIWHIDEARNSNAREGQGPKNVSPHYLVTVEEADCLNNEWPYWDEDGVPGSFKLERGPYHSGDIGDVFPGTSDNRNFHVSTWPNSNAYLGDDSESKCAVLEISDSADTMTVVLDVARLVPVLQVTGYDALDDAGGDGDGRAESEETTDIVVSLESIWGDAPGVTATLTTEDPDVTILDANGTFGDLDGGSSGDNSADPFTVEIGSVEGARSIEFTLELTSYPMGQSYTITPTIEVVVGWPRVLLVDDDGGEELEEIFRSDLAAAGIDLYDQWSVADGSGTVRDPYATENVTIVWFTGESETETLTEADRAGLSARMDAGANLVLSGQYLTEDIGDTDFFADYLHVASDLDNTMQGIIVGVAGHPILADFESRPMVMIQASASSLTPLGDALSGMVYLPGGQTAVATWDGNPGGTDHKVATLGFDPSLIQNDAERVDLLYALAMWQSPTGIEDGGAPAAPVGPRAVLDTNVPNPFNPMTQISFALPEATHAQLRVYSMAGARIRTLADGYLVAGRHTVRWDGTDGSGHAVPSGVYIYRLETGNEVLSRKMVILK